MQMHPSSILKTSSICIDEIQGIPQLITFVVSNLKHERLVELSSPQIIQEFVVFLSCQVSLLCRSHI